MYVKVSGVCNGLMWATENRERGKHAVGHRWRDNFTFRAPLAAYCGWALGNRLGKRLKDVSELGEAYQLE